MESVYLVPILLSVIALFAGVLNLFIAFILRIMWSEIKTGEKKHDKEIDKLHDNLRSYQVKMDEQLHNIKTEIVKLGVKFNKEVSA